MSDLAPFVASVLRDKNVQDLQEENNALRKALRQSRAVEVTGFNGSPVYATAQFEDGASEGDDDLFWCITFRQPNVTPFSLAEIHSLELWAGGIRRFQFLFSAPFGVVDDKIRDYQNLRGRIHLLFHPSIEIQLIIEVGPLSRDEWHSLAPHGDRRILVSSIVETLLGRFGDRDGFTVSVFGVRFRNNSVHPALHALPDEEHGT